MNNMHTFGSKQNIGCKWRHITVAIRGFQIWKVNLPLITYSGFKELLVYKICFSLYFPGHGDNMLVEGERKHGNVGSRCLPKF